MNELFGNVNATADGIIGTQTATRPITNSVISPPDDDLPSDGPPALELMAEKEQVNKRPVEKEPSGKEPVNKRPVDNQFDLSEDDDDATYRFPPPLKRQGLDDTRHYSDHSGENSDGSINQTATPATPKPRAYNKKPAPRVRPNTKAKLASSLENSAELLKNQAAEALDRDRVRSKTIAAHDAAKESMLVTAARLDRESLAFRLNIIPSQDQAMAIFNKDWKDHFGNNPKAASEAILLFEHKEKCQTFINAHAELRWSWLALSLGYAIVNEKENENEKEKQKEKENEKENEDKQENENKQENEQGNE